MTPADVVQKKAPNGCAMVGCAALAFVAVIAVVFVHQVFVYYVALSNGGKVASPYASQFTRVGGAVAQNTTSALPPEQLAPTDRPSLGAAKPAITVVEFADFQCPYSLEEHSVVRRLAAQYGGSVRFVYREFPLDSIHPDATTAANAAECAQSMGKFWEYHDKVYANANALDKASLVKYAGQIGLDSAKFSRCLSDKTYASRVQKDLQDGAASGVVGTPTFFVNGYKVEGAIPEDKFSELLQQAGATASTGN